LKSSSSLISGLTVAVLAVALILAGYGAAIAVGGVGGKGVSTTTVTSNVTNSTSNSPFVITLVISTNSNFNSTEGAQPAYFVLGPSGLQSSAQISLPANRLIKLVIVNYDDGNATLNVPNDNVVSGTTNGTIFVASNSNINASEGASGIAVNGGQTLSSVPVADIAHTFTVPGLNLNIPVPTSSTVVAYFTVSKSGTYTWFCETSCGDAPMSTQGWMTGSLVAS
jgi:F0F1-type ATP synthase membrane subunit c/vacuolar-type H+-ATPase subunit K